MPPLHSTLFSLLPSKSLSLLSTCQHQLCSPSPHSHLQTIHHSNLSPSPSPSLPLRFKKIQQQKLKSSVKSPTATATTPSTHNSSAKQLKSLTPPRDTHPSSQFRVGDNVFGEGSLYAQGTKCAELQAVDKAGEFSRGATAYLNMELGDCDADQTAVSSLIKVSYITDMCTLGRKFKSCCWNKTPFASSSRHRYTLIKK